MKKSIKTTIGVVLGVIVIGAIVVFAHGDLLQGRLSRHLEKRVFVENLEDDLGKYHRKAQESRSFLKTSYDGGEVLSAYDWDNCYDSDGGNYTGVHGVVYGKLDSRSAGSNYSDYCGRGGLVEYYCEGNYVKSLSRNCVLGCESGACVKVHEVCGNGVDDDKDGKVDCLDGACGETDYCDVEVGKNLCLLDDGKQNSVFVGNYDLTPLEVDYSRLYVVEDIATCKLLTAEFYDKISPSFIPKEGGYPGYEASTDKINLICEEPCEINHDLLDWRLNKLTELYERTAEAFGIDQLWHEELIDYHISQVDSDGLLTESGFYFPVGGNGHVYYYEGKNFLKYIETLSQDGDKFLHQDYVDKAYRSAFETENTPIHEMIHNAFGQYGDFSYNYEESFCHVVGAMLGGKGESKNDTHGDIKPDSFCYNQFHLIGYPLLWHLCDSYGFDIDDMPEFFDVIEEKYLQSGELGDDDLIDAVSIVVGEDASPVFEQIDDLYE